MNINLRIFPDPSPEGIVKLNKDGTCRLNALAKELGISSIAKDATTKSTQVVAIEILSEKAFVPKNQQEQSSKADYQIVYYTREDYKKIQAANIIPPSRQTAIVKAATLGASLQQVNPPPTQKEINTIEKEKQEDEVKEKEYINRFFSIRNDPAGAKQLLQEMLARTEDNLFRPIPADLRAFNHIIKQMTLGEIARYGAEDVFGMNEKDATTRLPSLTFAVAIPQFSKEQLKAYVNLLAKTYQGDEPKLKAAYLKLMQVTSNKQFLQDMICSQPQAFAVIMASLKFDMSDPLNTITEMKLDAELALHYMKHLINNEALTPEQLNEFEKTYDMGKAVLDNQYGEKTPKGKPIRTWKTAIPEDLRLQFVKNLIKAGRDNEENPGWPLQDFIKAVIDAGHAKEIDAVRSEREASLKRSLELQLPGMPQSISETSVDSPSSGSFPSPSPPQTPKSFS